MAQKHLPATITRFDPAGALPLQRLSELTPVPSATEDGDAALVLGEGSPDDMVASGKWIQMDAWAAYDKHDPRSLQ